MFRLFAFATLLVLGTVQAAPPATPFVIPGLPPIYRDNVIKMSADNGNPNPPTWSILAYRSGDKGALMNITMANANVISEKASLNLGAILKTPTPIDFSKVAISPPAAFAIAQSYAVANGGALGSVSYALEQKGANATPVWTLWCYDKGGSYVAVMEILASDGTVVLSDGYPKRP